jgi:ATP synthase protein I
MSDHGDRAVTPASRAQKRAAAQGRAEGLEVGWTVSGYLISGLLAYGIIGWLIGRAVHIWFLFPVGMLVGLAISVGFVIYRYGVQGAATQPGTSARVQREMTGDR